MRKWTCSLVVLVGLISESVVFAQQAPDDSPWLTVAEASDFQSTCTSAEVEAFIDRAVATGSHLSRMEFGRTVEDRPMTAVVCANPPFDERQRDSRAVALVIGNIHSGECAGKEGLLMLLRDLAQQPDHPWLKNLVVVIVPNYNADGNDKIAVNNRPGQDGPANGMGRRETSEGFDLNRDFVKLDTREARAMVGLIDRLNPHLFIDCHTTNGSRHQYALTYDVPHNPSSPAVVRNWMRESMMPTITERLNDRDIKTFYYGNFDRNLTRWTTYGSEPRYSTEYVGMRGRLAVLSEAYSYISYRDRIIASKEFVTECLNYLHENQSAVQELLASVEHDWIEAASSSPDSLQMHLQSDLQAYERPYDILGFEGDQPKTYSVQFYSNYIPTVSRSVPFAYSFSGDLARVAERLKAHGIEVETLAQDKTVEVDQPQVTKLNRASRAFQQHYMTTLEVVMNREKRTLPSGSFIVRTDQPLGRLAAYMLEAETDDGLVTWNQLDDYLGENKPFPIVRILSPIAGERSKQTDEKMNDLPK